MLSITNKKIGLIQKIYLSTSTTSVKPQRTMIIPQPFTVEKFDSWNLIKSNKFDFVISPEINLSNNKQIYQHKSDTPSSLLKKQAIHIFADSMPQFNRRQQYSAFLKNLQKRYQNSYSDKTPNEIFHLNRKIKGQIKRKAELIGFLSDKYKNYRKYKSMAEFLKEKTQEQYRKKGVTVKALDNKVIYPKGQVWLPTNQAYLTSFIQILQKFPKTQIQNILDIGCGSGILSYITAKHFKSAKVIGIDCNQNALQTTKINSVTLQLKNIQAHKFDIVEDQFQMLISSAKVPQNFDIIISNPPWIIATPLKTQSSLSLGVYDSQGKMLANSLKMASKLLKNQSSRLLLLYSDLSKNLLLEKKSVQALCLENNLLIYSKKETPMATDLKSKSPLNIFKQRSKMQLYEIGKAN